MHTAALVLGIVSLVIAVGGGAGATSLSFMSPLLHLPPVPVQRYCPLSHFHCIYGWCPVQRYCPLSQLHCICCQSQCNVFVF